MVPKGISKGFSMDALIHIRNDAVELRLLLDVCQVLDATYTDPDARLEELLRTMARHTGMECGTVLLRNPDGSIRREAGYGLLAQAVFPVHEGGPSAVRLVLQSAAPAAVSASASEAFALDRAALQTRSKEELAFIAVPVMANGQALGVLAADKLFADSVALEEDVRLLQVIASLISQALLIRLDFEQRHSAVVEENRRLQALLKGGFRPAGIKGNSGAIRAVFAELAQVADSNATVLIRGESGTGKELAAVAIHAGSPRADKPFVRLNCAALPEGLVESELFGHERGAFTGATGLRKGRFEMADGGTLFLDEVGDLTPLTQAKLLRVLQEKQFERVGSAETRQVDVRLIAATNRDLEHMVAEGTFRQDLYYRLSVFPIILPPLRQRREDIMPLATHFIEKYAQENSRSILRVSVEATALLSGYSWPGNVRELENVMERAVLLCGPAGVIEAAHLPPALQAARPSPTVCSTQAEGGTLEAALDSLECRLVTEALQEAEGNMSKAAARLGITERIMGLRMTKYGLNFRTFRRGE